MLDPSYLATCANEVESMFAELEISILEDIARRIRENKYVNTSTAQYQINRAKALGMQTEEINKQIAKLLKVSEKRVSQIISESSFSSVESDNMIFKSAYEKGLIAKFEFNEENIKQYILKGITATNGEVRNICKTTARTAQKLLTNSMDQAYLAIQSGVFSPQDAISQSIKKVAEQGIEWVDFKSGTHRRLDSTVRNAVRTGVNKTACQCQEKNFDDMGGNLVEVSSHMGARPDHALWQGKIYWWKKPYKNYRNFEQATGYGTGKGLGGWNCRHNFFPYFEGLSSKTFEHYRIGENQERYELDQEQRYNERKIREWKRRSAVNKAGGVDNTKEARKVREWEQRQREFLKEHPELKRDYAREIVEKRRFNVQEFATKRNEMLLKGYNKAVEKGDISSFITFDIYAKQAHEIDENIVGIKAKHGIMITGYKTHFIDRQIGQYESSNEPVKKLRQGVSIEDIKDCLLYPKEVRKKSDTDWNYISDSCKITVNPKTGVLIQTNPFKRKKVKK